MRHATRELACFGQVEKRQKLREEAEELCRILTRLGDCIRLCRLSKPHARVNDPNAQVSVPDLPQLLPGNGGLTRGWEGRGGKGKGRGREGGRGGKGREGEGRKGRKRRKQA